MLRRLSTAVPLALAATLVVPAAAHDAPSCVATATPPHPEPSRPGLHASGTFTCAVPAYDLFVTVCVERLQHGADAGWSTLGCSSMVLNDGGSSVTADVTVATPEETAVLRATVTGSNDRGDTASGTSAPVVWPRCGCP